MIERPVFLLGMPRSGTTWLSQIFESHPNICVRLSPNYSYALKNRLSNTSSREQWIEILSQAAASDDAFLTQNWRRDSGQLPRHTHAGAAECLVVKDTRFHALYRAGMERLPAARCLYVVRNPCAVLHSWANSDEFPDGARIEDEWRTGACRKLEGPGESWGFDDWCLETRAYLDLQREQPERFRVFRYEDMVRDPEATCRQLFGFAGVDLHAHVLTFVEQSHSSHDPHPHSVFKDPTRVVSRWRGQLPASIVGAIEDELAGTELEEYLA